MCQTFWLVRFGVKIASCCRFRVNEFHLGVYVSQDALMISILAKRIDDGHILQVGKSISTCLFCQARCHDDNFTFITFLHIAIEVCYSPIAIRATTEFPYLLDIVLF